MIQKKIHYILIAFLIFSCDTYEENSLDFVNDINAPSNVDFVIDISEDNQAIVKITPFGDGLLNSTVDFGDDSELSDEITPGNFVIHDYDEEGTYDITINAKGVSGKTTSFTKTVDVLYSAPSIPEITVTPRSSDPYTILVNASSDFAVSYDVYFGEIQDEEPITILPNDVAIYTYSDEGVYDITVVAHSGGAATSEGIAQYELPSKVLVDFETNLPSITALQDAESQVISNPNPNLNNSSEQVLELTKGTKRSFSVLELNETFKTDGWGRLKVKIHTSKLGSKFTLRLKTASNYSVSVKATSTVENDWEELIFDLSKAPIDKEFSRIFIYPDYNISNTGEVFYFDDFELIY